MRRACISNLEQSLVVFPLYLAPRSGTRLDLGGVGLVSPILGAFAPAALAALQATPIGEKRFRTFSLSLESLILAES
jgi:hypothetical protein